MVATVGRYKWILLVLASAFTMILLQISFLTQEIVSPASEETIRNNLDERTTLSQALAPYFEKMEFPTELVLKNLNEDHEDEEKYTVEYTVDNALQSQADKLLSQYKPDYGAIFMMDAETGKVIVYSSFQRDAQEPVNLIKRASYPAASVFKIVTATAAIDKAGLQPGHKIQFNGGNWTLYKKNVMLDKINRWTRTVSLREAFAKSMNTPFGKIGLSISPTDLEDYSTRFMFNQVIPTDFPVDTGTAVIPSEKTFELTEAASGFTKHTRMSPVQGAMIAASIINDGAMVVPYMVSSLRDKDGNIVYRGEGLERGSVMSTASAEKIREMMSETLVTGTSRKTFRNLIRNKKYQQIEMGGKTGHLTGDNPQGSVDWFVGYASDGDRHIAIAALTVNKKYWTVKSSHLGQTLFKKYFDPAVQVAKLGPVNY
ncbi:MAG: penicillin-binding protein [Bdellovibrionales bacterium]|nr:penicillin-binding protein [Bdellovibrionales bacterium]